MKRTSLLPTLACLLLTTTACRRDMQDQPKYKPLAASRFFADGRNSRPLPEGVVARDELDDEDAFHTGAQGGNFLAIIPMPVTTAMLERGRDRYDIFCSPCHGRTGDGYGMIRQRGFWIPADLHTERLRAVPPGYIYQVIANGYGSMPDYRDQIAAADRWAIVAYVDALQLSRHANISDLPADARSQLAAQPQTAPRDKQ